MDRLDMDRAALHRDIAERLERLESGMNGLSYALADDLRDMRGRLKHLQAEVNELAAELSDYYKYMIGHWKRHWATRQ
jgi:hypothetical protein